MSQSYTMISRAFLTILCLPLSKLAQLTQAWPTTLLVGSISSYLIRKCTLLSMGTYIRILTNLIIVFLRGPLSYPFQPNFLQLQYLIYSPMIAQCICKYILMTTLSQLPHPFQRKMRLNLLIYTISQNYTQYHLNLP